MTVGEHVQERGEPRAAHASAVVRLGVALGTVLVILGLAVLPLLTPPVIHPMLDLADASGLTGLGSTEVHTLSDRSVATLVGGGSFAFDGPDGAPFYDASERAHLADARLLLWLLLAAALASAGLVGVRLARSRSEERVELWRTVSIAGGVAALAVAAIGLLSLVAFETLFTLFHQVFFPAGNWAFDADTQRLVQLYPFAFWQLAAGAFGLLVLVLGAATWLLGRTMARTSRATPDRLRLER